MAKVLIRWTFLEGGCSVPLCKNTFVCFQKNTLEFFLLFANVLVLSRVIDARGSILRVTILGDLFGRRQGHE
jgi:hypothetical protein